MTIVGVVENYVKDSIPDQSPRFLSTSKRRAEIGMLEVLPTQLSVTFIPKLYFCEFLGISAEIVQTPQFSLLADNLIGK